MMRLKEKLSNNTLSIGSWITISHPTIVEVMATAGFDWLTIDMEHSSIGIESVQNLITHIQSNQMDALVRVSKNDDVIIKRVMDAGADGIIVPMVNSKDDAKRAVRYVQYPPNGIRGVGLARAQKFGIGFNEYKKWLENESVIIAQIEHVDAVKNISDIITVKGIDGVLIGPYDLSGSLGIPGEFDSKEFAKAVERIEKVCRDHNKSLGFHVIDPIHDRVKDKIESGYNFLAFSVDFLFLGQKAREEMECINLMKNRLLTNQ